jgi:nicastrin
MKLPLAIITVQSLLYSISAEDGTTLNKPFESSFARLQHAPCVSLYHRNGRQGCGTEGHKVQNGQLQYFDGSLPSYDKPYVAVMEEYRLSAQNVKTLMAASATGLLQGVLVLNSTSSSSDDITYKSPESQTPQGYGTPSEGINYGYYAYPWNPKGENILGADLYGLPMAYVLDSSVSSTLRDEAQDQSKETAIVAEFNYYMGPDGITSKECLAWKDKANDEWKPKCLPLGGTSVWATAGAPPKSSSSSSSSSSSNNNNANNNANSNKSPVFILATGMDSTSMFHDTVPGANAAASNILALLMAAKLVGESIDDDTLGGFTNRILFGFFQGEAYGFLGSRSFLRDVAYPGFKCYGTAVPAVTRSASSSNVFACPNPLRPSLNFASIGSVVGMLTVDQVGHAVGEGLLYAHADKNNDQYGAFLANVLKASSTSDVTVAASSVASGDYGYPYPPTPLTSLLSLSEGAVGGAILAGYDYAFPYKPPYHSHRDIPAMAENLGSIAASATILARTAVAAAYDQGDLDYNTVSQYANNLIPELSVNDETFLKLANCLFQNGQCDLFRQYAKVEVENARIQTGLSIGMYDSNANPPNYYVGVYNGIYGQPFVQVGDNVYGAYEGQDYGKKNTDAFGIQPRMMESAIHGLLNDFLGRGALINSSSKVTSCKTMSDCSDVQYCSSNGPATCTGGGQCVCSRSNYHIALDESLKAAKNMPTGFFVIPDDDAGVSPMYTEPYWSSSVGVRVYRDVGSLPGFFTLAVGLVVGFFSLFAAFVLRVGLKKEKLY